MLAASLFSVLLSELLFPPVDESPDPPSDLSFELASVEESCPDELESEAASDDAPEEASDDASEEESDEELEADVALDEESSSDFTLTIGGN